MSLRGFLASGERTRTGESGAGSGDLAGGSGDTSAGPTSSASVSLAANMEGAILSSSEASASFGEAGAEGLPAREASSSALMPCTVGADCALWTEERSSVESRVYSVAET